MDGPRMPDQIIFFPNGTAAVSVDGRQASRHQRGWHGTTIAALAADGIDWHDIPVRLGSPMAGPPWWWDAGHEARLRAEDADG
jgi:hypothetical protein